MNKNCYEPYHAQSSCITPMRSCTRCINEIETNDHYDSKHMTETCKKESFKVFPENPVTAMAYVPVQELHDIYECSKALSFGTIFPELNKPFMECCRYE